MTVPLTFSPEVAEARAAGHAIVALESTIITHGMPYPQNLETARAGEAAVRDAGAVPATIAVRVSVVALARCGMSSAFSRPGRSGCTTGSFS